MRKLILFSAPSGAGKTTIVQRLMSLEGRLQFSISATNRSPRELEVDGVDYHFLTTPEFEEKIKDGDFIEWEEVYERMYYGTLKSEVENIQQRGKIPIFDVDVKGGISLKSKFGKELLSVFIAPPSLNALKSRLENRGTESSESLEKRLAKAGAEMEFQDKFDCVIVNDKLEVAVSEAHDLLKEFLDSSSE